jgi:hypothetical protein
LVEVVVYFKESKTHRVPALEINRGLHVSVGSNNLQAELIEPLFNTDPNRSRVPFEDRLEAAWSKEILPAVGLDPRELDKARYLKLQGGKVVGTEAPADAIEATKVPLLSLSRSRPKSPVV